MSVGPAKMVVAHKRSNTSEEGGHRLNDHQRRRFIEQLESIETAMWTAAKAVQTIRKLVSGQQASYGEEAVPSQEASEGTLAGTTAMENAPVDAREQGMVPCAQPQGSSTSATAASSSVREWVSAKNTPNRV